MAIAFIQGAKNFTVSGTSCVRAFTSNNAAGNCLVLAVGVWKLGTGTAALFTSPTVTDTAGNSWRKVIAGPRSFVSPGSNYGQSQAFIFVAYNCAAGANTVTVTVNMAVDIDIVLSEFSGAAAVNAVDQATAIQRSGDFGTNTLMFTAQYPNELLFTVGYDKGNATPVFTPSAGWTIRNQTNSTANHSLVTMDLNVTTRGNYTNTVTKTTTPFGNAYHLLMISLSDTPNQHKLVQCDSAGTNVVVSSISKAFRVNNTVGNFLVLSVGYSDPNAPVPTITVSDSNGNSWVFLIDSTVDPTNGFGGMYSKMWTYWVPSCVSGANTVTVTFSRTVRDIAIAISEFSSLSYPATVLAEPSLVGYYRLEETSGTIAYDSKGTNHGTIVNPGNVTLGVASVPGIDNCYTFGGGNGYVSINQVIGAGDYSVEFWFRTSAIPIGVSNIGAPAESGFGLVNSTNGGQNDWGLALARVDGETQVIGQCGSMASVGYFGVNSDPAVDLSDGAWHYVVLTHVQSTGLSKLYIDGVLKGTATLGTWSQNATATIRFASITFGGGSFLPGNLDEIALYNTALSESQIAAHLAALGGVTVSPTFMKITKGSPSLGSTEIKGAGMGTNGSGVLYSSVFDNVRHGQGFKTGPARIAYESTSSGWKMRENAASNSSAGQIHGCAMCVLDQAPPLSGTYQIAIGVEETAWALHNHVVAFTPGNQRQPQLFSPFAPIE